MTHQEQLVANLTEVATPLLKEYLDQQPLERRQRLDGLEEMLEEVIEPLALQFFHVWVKRLSERAEAVAGTCSRCGRRTRRETKTAKVRLKRFTTELEAVRYRCRSCKTNSSPIRAWLGLQSGMTSAGLDRAVTALATEMSFGRAAKQMQEQHGHAVDRTLVERRAYAVGKQGIEFLEEQRQARRDEVMDSVGLRPGVDRVLLQVDGGAVPVGRLERPAPEETTERTAVRNLPKGTRTQTKREVRVILAWKDGTVEAKVTDVHIAPHNHPEVSGERMYAAALEAGMGDQTHVHCTCDMAAWQRKQFEEQFSAQPNRSLCADFYHALEYVAQAGRCLLADQEQEERTKWIAIQAGRLKRGERDEILRELHAHSCSGGRCVHNDNGECSVRAARRYLRKHGEHMDYPRFIEEDLPIGSGAVEGRIRHILRHRLDIPGAWREENLHPMMALISIRESGLWDTFWDWLRERDQTRFHERLQGRGLNKFRGTTPAPPEPVDTNEGFGIEPSFDTQREPGLPMVH